MATFMFNPCSPCCGKIKFAVMVFIDESSPYTGTTNTTYLIDVANFNAFIELHKSKGIYLSIVHYGGPPYGTIKPTDDPLPEHFSGPYVLTRPNPSLEEFQQHWNDFVGNNRPTRIAMVVDNSGSMSTSSLGSNYPLFLDWLREKYVGAQVDDKTYSSERWVMETQDTVHGLINEQ